MRFWEEYGCGCVSLQSSKKDLPGYCPQHGVDRRHIYRSDGKLVNGDPAFSRFVKRETVEAKTFDRDWKEVKPNA